MWPWPGHHDVPAEDVHHLPIAAQHVYLLVSSIDKTGAHQPLCRLTTTTITTRITTTRIPRHVDDHEHLRLITGPVAEKTFPSAVHQPKGRITVGRLAEVRQQNAGTVGGRVVVDAAEVAHWAGEKEVRPLGGQVALFVSVADVSRRVVPYSIDYSAGEVRHAQVVLVVVPEEEDRRPERPQRLVDATVHQGGPLSAHSLRRHVHLFVAGKQVEAGTVVDAGRKVVDVEVGGEEVHSTRRHGDGHQVELLALEDTLAEVLTKKGKGDDFAELDQHESDNKTVLTKDTTKWKLE